MESYQEVATVRPHAAFDASADAKALRAAMKGWGTNEQEIIDILCHRSNQQRQHIRNAYTTELGRDLIADLKSELGGKFESVIVGLMMSTADYCAKQLHKAMKGAGTDEETLVEILCSRTFDEVKQIADAYHAAYGNSLDKDIKGDTSGPLQRLLILALQDTRNERYVDARQAAEQAKLLYRAGEGKLGTDEDTFIEILSHSGQHQAFLIFEEYKKISGRTIEQALRDEMSGELLTGLLAIVKTVNNRPAYFAERLRAAMEGFGTDDTMLVRILVGRSEIDLGNIKHEYEKLYGKTLLSAVKSETSGDYGKALLALIGDA